MWVFCELMQKFSLVLFCPCFQKLLWNCSSLNPNASLYPVYRFDWLESDYHFMWSSNSTKVEPSVALWLWVWKSLFINISVFTNQLSSWIPRLLSASLATLQGCCVVNHSHPHLFFFSFFFAMAFSGALRRFQDPPVKMNKSKVGLPFSQATLQTCQGSWWEWL